MESIPHPKRMSYAEINQKLGHEIDHPELRTTPADFDYFLSESEDTPSQFAKDWEALSYGSIESNSTILDLLSSGNIDEEWDIDSNSPSWRVTEGLSILDDFRMQAGRCLEAGDSQMADPRHQFVAECYRAYQIEHTDAAADVWDSSFTQIIDFLKFYKESFDEYAAEYALPEKIAAWRQEFIDFIASDEGSLLFQPSSLPRIIAAAKVTPITLLDPIASLDRDEQLKTHLNTFGSFRGLLRTIDLDLSAISKQAAESDPTQLDTSIQRTLLHEFVHALSDSHYHEDLNATTDDLRWSIRTDCLWPRFWSEGMTEKIATFIQSKLLPLETLPAASLDRDEQLYTTEALLVTDQTRALVTSNLSTYDSYRELIDIVMDRLDWEQAGLTYEEASLLATHAFTEVPEDTKAGETSKRLGFIEAVNAASHPGFFMKLQNAVEVHGVNYVSAVLKGTRFQPHNPRSLTFTANAKYARHLAIHRTLLDEIESTDPSPFHYTSSNFEARAHRIDTANIAEIKRMAGRSALLTAALDAEYVLLMQTNGVGRYSPEAALLRAITHVSPEKEKADRQRLKAAQRAMQQWIDSLEPHDSI